MGSYLRTNYRITGRELDIDAIGGGLGWGKSSYISGAGTRRMHGGFIFGSWTGSLADSGEWDEGTNFSWLATGVLNISTYGAMLQYYGDGMFDSGYKFVPVAVWEGSVDASKTWFYSPWLSYCTSNADGSAYIDSMARVLVYKSSASGVIDDDFAKAGESAGSFRIFYAGFIVSGP